LKKIGSSEISFNFWTFQVIEVFFANDNNQYFDIRISPRGRYFGVIYKDEQKSALAFVPQQEGRLHSTMFDI
jgi:hypothetical protein